MPGQWSLKGAKRVVITGVGDRRQITTVLCGTMAGEFLPPLPRKNDSLCSTS